MTERSDLWQRIYELSKTDSMMFLTEYYIDLAKALLEIKNELKELKQNG